MNSEAHVWTTGLILLLFPISLYGESQAGVTENPEVIALEEIVVTASRTDQRLKDLPAHATILTKREIQQSAAQVLDDLLRQVPGFSLFRRSSSIVAHPTTQGVSLRGIGGSGSSRTLVLVDGFPLNDPFGGWVQWSKVGLVGVERIEVLRGGGSHIWGNYALGGVIQVVTEQPQKRGGSLSAGGGSGKTASMSFTANDRFGSTGVGLAGSYFNTGGYPIVRKDQRGKIDINADSKNRMVRLKLTHDFSPNAEISFQSSFFNEERDNGTPLTQNGTDAGFFGIRSVLRKQDGNKLTFTGFSHVQRFKSFFSSQSSDRNSERPALDQFNVPSTAIGLSLEWLRPTKASHLFTSGLDFRWASGETQEDFRFATDKFIRRRKAGGDQQGMGFYIQDIFYPQRRLQFTAGGRVDLWRSFGGFRRETDLETNQVIRNDVFADRTRWVFNPKAGLLFALSDGVSFRGSFYRTFRAPTLNELFRPFRVGNVITSANEDLDPERLVGGDVGLDFVTPFLTGRFTGYWNEVEGSIVNLTIGSGPGSVSPCGFVPAGGLCRQRHNLERTRFRGFEAELSYRFRRFLSCSVSYLLSDSKILRAPGKGGLEGKRIPQIPANQVVLKVGFVHPEYFSASVQGRYVGTQFEDDSNLFELGGFGVLDFSFSRSVDSKREVFFTVENMLNQSYAVGLGSNGLETIGALMRIQGGVRLWI